MDQETSDFILGAGLLVVFLVLLYPAGKLLHRIQNARYTRAWEPLIPVIGGKVVDDPGGGAKRSPGVP